MFCGNGKSNSVPLMELFGVANELRRNCYGGELEERWRSVIRNSFYVNLKKKLSKKIFLIRSKRR